MTTTPTHGGPASLLRVADDSQDLDDKDKKAEREQRERQQTDENSPKSLSVKLKPRTKNFVRDEQARYRDGFFLRQQRAHICRQRACKESVPPCGPAFLAAARVQQKTRE